MLWLVYRGDGVIDRVMILPYQLIKRFNYSLDNEAGKAVAGYAWGRRPRVEYTSGASQVCESKNIETFAVTQLSTGALLSSIQLFLCLRCLAYHGMRTHSLMHALSRSVCGFFIDPQIQL